MENPQTPPRPWLDALIRWFDVNAIPAPDTQAADARRVDLLRVIPFMLMHIACLSVIWVGWSPFAVAVAVGLYVLRMFAITGFYHRYFSHKAFRTSRPVQLAFAIIGAAAVQRGPIWWAAHHRHHHANSDQDDDTHSPVRHGLFWSHVGWFLCKANFPTRRHLVKDWLKFPELCFLDRFDIAVPVVFGLSLYAIGAALGQWAPGMGTSGGQLFVWGFLISTIVLYHATFTINSLCHVWGSRRYATPDGSRNNPWLALITLGEGWHNNHHHYPRSARQGFYWWEFDLTYYLLKLMASLGIIWDLKALPAAARERGHLDRPADSGASA
ncbi:MAG: acyl-CoA desaturase [Candidatus Methylumidiphilus sp.]